MAYNLTKTTENTLEEYGVTTFNLELISDRSLSRIFLDIAQNFRHNEYHFLDWEYLQDSASGIFFNKFPGLHNALVEDLAWYDIEKLDNKILKLIVQETVNDGGNTFVNFFLEYKELVSVVTDLEGNLKGYFLGNIGSKENFRVYLKPTGEFFKTHLAESNLVLRDSSTELKFQQINPRNS